MPVHIYIYIYIYYTDLSVRTRNWPPEELPLPGVGVRWSQRDTMLARTVMWGGNLSSTCLLNKNGQTNCCPTKSLSKNKMSRPESVVQTFRPTKCCPKLYVGKNVCPRKLFCPNCRSTIFCPKNVSPKKNLSEKNYKGTRRRHGGDSPDFIFSRDWTAG